MLPSERKSRRALTEGTGALLAALRQAATSDATECSAQPEIVTNAPVYDENVESKRARVDDAVVATVPLADVELVVEPPVAVDIIVADVVPPLPIVEYNFSKPRLLQTCVEEFVAERCTNNYLKSCYWSPDGQHMIVTSQDRRVRVFDYDEVCCASASAHAWVTQKSSRVRLTLRIGHGDLIYDTCWLPAVGEASFASTSRCAPIHLWSACDGRRIATYRGINHLDEMASAYSVLATADGRQLVGGYKKCLRVFDLSRPDRQTRQIDTVAKRGTLAPSQPGILACMAQSPHNADVLVVGAYTGSIGTYSLSKDATWLQGCQALVPQAHIGGVTHVRFDPVNEWRIYSGARMDEFINVWDTRMFTGVMAQLTRPVRTNQRVHFEVTRLGAVSPMRVRNNVNRCGKYVVSGTSDGLVSVWHTTTCIDTRSVTDFKPVTPTHMFAASTCTVAGVSVHPSAAVLATCGGERTFPQPRISVDNDAASSDDEQYINRRDYDNSLRLWSVV